MNKGKVYLIGAGPGDPKLITVRGQECIEKADVVVYDRLASPRLLRKVKPGARKIFVGKLPDKHMMKQEDINRLLVDLALQGNVVARLKGGDPSVFGRVGEEAELLAEHEVPFEIVPGITSAISVPAYAGIPVTHRDFTSSFSIVTGHEYPNKTYNKINWPNLAGASGTLIFLMGVANIEQISSELIMWGKKRETPVALIRWGTWMEQETLTGTLENIAAKVKEANFQSPAVIIVGEVVRLREKLAWFEKKPLFGRRVLVTRSREQASDLSQRIDDLGGEAVEFPVINIQSPSKPEALAHLDSCLESLDQFDWVAFTSTNGVEYFFRRLAEKRIDIRKLYRARIAAVGPKTAEALQVRGIVPDVTPGRFQGDILAEELLPQVKAGEKLLLPTADIASSELPSMLEQHGVVVSKVDVYENVPSTEYGEEIIELLQNKAIHIITFTSSSTVSNLFKALEVLGTEDPLALLEGVKIACIGPKTAETAVKYGLQVHYLAKEATIESLVDSIITSN